MQDRINDKLRVLEQTEGQELTTLQQVATDVSALLARITTGFEDQDGGLLYDLTSFVQVLGEDLGTAINVLNNQMPSAFDVISDTASHTGAWTKILLAGGTFPDDATGMTINNLGVNLSALNGNLPNGTIIEGNIQKITLSGGVVLAYRTR